VTAYKFRDPDGHPLELSFIPGSSWTARASGRRASPFLGIDHSALAVRDIQASLNFYINLLGFSKGGVGLNQGPEQDRLDGLPNASVDIISVRALAGGPHLELLHYRSPPSHSAPTPLDPTDIAATRLIVQVDSWQRLADRLDAAGARFAVLEDEAGTGLRVHDPDQHALEFRSSA
jgi:catechol 2,3-dioxygenase-like lactoylglutathione lyase family enzyme